MKQKYVFVLDISVQENCKNKEKRLQIILQRNQIISSFVESDSNLFLKVGKVQNLLKPKTQNKY